MRDQTDRLAQALNEASVYGIGATSDTNQRVILDAAKALAAQSSADSVKTECPNCHNANKYGDYEGPVCDVCGGAGVVSESTQPRASADSAQTRTFDTTGTFLRRSGKVLTITCDSDEIANRITDQLRTEPQSAREKLLLKALEAVRFNLTRAGYRPNSIMIEGINKAVALTTAQCQAEIEQRHMAQLLTVLDVMKSAHNKEPGRLMSIWSRDIEAVEAAMAALTRPERKP